MTDDGRKVSSRAEKRRRKKQKEEEKKETNSTFNDIFTVSEKITTLNFCTLWWPSGQSSQHNTDHYTVLYFTTQKKWEKKGGKHLGGAWGQGNTTTTKK